MQRIKENKERCVSQTKEHSKSLYVYPNVRETKWIKQHKLKIMITKMFTRLGEEHMNEVRILMKRKYWRVPKRNHGTD